MATTKSLIGTRTQVNLANAYVAESCAYSRYTFYATQAQKEGYFQYANILNETAANELRHAKIYFKYLNEAGVKTDPIAIDAGVIGKTVDNLKVAAQEEQTEGVDAYVEAAKVADEEGFADIAGKFRAIATIEMHHKERFEKMIKHIEDGTVWKSDKPVKWQCLVCGYIYEGTEPPKVCPACSHPYQHFEREEVFS
ncbi:MAG: rubrerythrin family protein [Candidatus Amulumruptor caecigallinarius]|nr:rubrerythrin family protein [Candidatus Amulumruptor caecigallinarius]